MKRTRQNAMPASVTANIAARQQAQAHAHLPQVLLIGMPDGSFQFQAGNFAHPSQIPVFIAEALKQIALSQVPPDIRQRMTGRPEVNEDGTPKIPIIDGTGVRV